MTNIEISRQVYEKYQVGGRLSLTTNYIQRIFEADGYPGMEGVVLILKGRADHNVLDGINKSYCYRCRISDGIFTYNICFSGDLKRQIEKEMDNLVSGTVFAITDLQTVPQQNTKPLVLINGYTLLSRGHSAMAAADSSKTHPGDMQTHKDYRTDLVFEAHWPEAETFSGLQENLPPAAKIAKTDNGPVARKPAPPPPAPTRKGSSKAESGVIPIEAVTPYMSNIKIHGMCSRKEEIRLIPAKNNLKIFNFELTDAKGDCIRIVAFNELAESMSSLIQESMSYYITGGNVRQANKKYNNTGHDYELALRNDSKVEPGAEMFATPKLVYKRVQLNKIGSHIQDLIDVIVVVEKMDENFTEFTSKQGRNLIKRELELIDETAVQARLTLWGEEAKNASTDLVGKVVLFKGVTPREFNGAYTLSTGSSTRIISCPEIPGVAELFSWYENERPNAEVKSISQGSGGSGEAPRTIAGITEMRFGTDSDKGDYATLKAMITRINPTNALYKGCPNEGCQKKVVEDAGEYRCEKCQFTSHGFKWLFMIQFEISDETGQIYVTAFGDTAAKIVGKSAQEVGAIKDTNEREYNALFERLQFKPKLWRVRCKMETYNEEVKQRLTVFSVDDVNKDKYIQHLEQLVQQLEGLSDI